jgi:hypothetical protein
VTPCMMMPRRCVTISPDLTAPEITIWLLKDHGEHAPVKTGVVRHAALTASPRRLL